MEHFQNDRIDVTVVCLLLTLTLLRKTRVIVVEEDILRPENITWSITIQYY